MYHVVLIVKNLVVVPGYYGRGSFVEVAVECTAEEPVVCTVEVSTASPGREKRFYEMELHVERLLLAFELAPLSCSFG